MSAFGGDNQIDQPLGNDPTFPHILFEILDGIHAEFVDNLSILENTSFTNWTATSLIIVG